MITCVLVDIKKIGHTITQVIISVGWLFGAIDRPTRKQVKQKKKSNVDNLKWFWWLLM